MRDLNANKTGVDQLMKVYVETISIYLRIRIPSIVLFWASTFLEYDRYFL